ncbi:MAG: DUF1788 domain-containing protein [Candidatus Reddybacter sp.]
MKQLQQRLDKIFERIESEEFLDNKGVSGEIGFYIFDYPPEEELLVRQHLKFLTEKLTKRGYQFSNINIFESIIQLLEEEGVLEDAFELQKNEGDEALREALKGVLGQEDIARYLSTKINPEEPQFVFLSGLGSAWPLIRGHSLLNALHASMGHTPLVLFYPGTYNGLELNPFGLVDSSNYYRAFQLIPTDRTH